MLLAVQSEHNICQAKDIAMSRVTTDPSVDMLFMARQTVSCTTGVKAVERTVS